MILLIQPFYLNLSTNTKTKNSHSCSLSTFHFLGAIAEITIIVITCKEELGFVRTAQHTDRSIRSNLTWTIWRTPRNPYVHNNFWTFREIYDFLIQTNVLGWNIVSCYSINLLMSHFVNWPKIWNPDISRNNSL